MGEIKSERMLGGDMKGGFVGDEEHRANIRAKDRREMGHV